VGGRWGMGVRRAPASDGIAAPDQTTVKTRLTVSHTPQSPMQPPHQTSHQTTPTEATKLVHALAE